jgi:flavin-binding protein dodecin
VVVADNVYLVSEVVGSSAEGTDAAIRNALARAAETVRHLDWFEVTQIRGHIENGAIGHFQVTMKVGFRLEES